MSDNELSEDEIDRAVEDLMVIYETLKDRPGWRRVVFKGDEGPYSDTGISYEFDQTQYRNSDDIIAMIRALKASGVRG